MVLILLNFVILITPIVIYYFYFFNIQKLSNINIDNEGKSIFEFSIYTNFLVFLSLYFFYTIPFYVNSFFEIKNISLAKFLIYVIIFIIFISFGFFEIVNFDNYGGGIFYKISKIIHFNLFFYLFAYFGLVLIMQNINSNNLLIYLCIIFAFPVTIVYQKYFDPLLILLLTTITLGGQLNRIIEENKMNLIIIFTYFGLFLLGTNFYYN